MKTFEERYTAWIDGQLTGTALTAFEQELARRAEAGDAAAEVDKADALQLRSPAQGTSPGAGADQHRVFQPPDARAHRRGDRQGAAARREANARPAWRFPAFAWPFDPGGGHGGGCACSWPARFITEWCRRIRSAAIKSRPSSASIAGDAGPRHPGGRRAIRPLLKPLVPASQREDNNEFALLTPIVGRRRLRSASTMMISRRMSSRPT